MNWFKSFIVATAFVLPAFAAAADQLMESPKERSAKAEAMFLERCKTAGVKITRTVEGVEGVYLLKIRPENESPYQQFSLHDPYGHDSTGDEYIKSFLYGRNAQGALTNREDVSKPGYRYVEAVDPKDGKRYRYTGSVREVEKKVPLHGGTVRVTEFTLDITPTAGDPPRYGVTYEDISTREEREYWIAGSSLRVIDLKTNEVIAERIGYMMDWAQGSTAGGRQPWTFANRNACPAFPNVLAGGRPYQIEQTRNFVERVLTPIEGK